MRRALVIQHVPSEGLGIIGPALERGGYSPHFIRVHENERVPKSAGGYAALIVLGGPMGVYEADKYPFIGHELGLIKSALKDQVPILGICLGSQLLARAAGAKVYKGGEKEIGWYKVRLTDEGIGDRLFLGLPSEFTVFQWHGDTFDVPAASANLAGSDLFPNQLIRVGRNAYGVQFHLEVTAAMIEEWITVNEDELKAQKGIDPERIKKESPGNLTALHSYCRSVIGRFIRLID